MQVGGLLSHCLGTSREMEGEAGKCSALDTGLDTADPLHCGFPPPEICRRDVICGVGFRSSQFVLGSYRSGRLTGQRLRPYLSNLGDKSGPLHP